MSHQPQNTNLSVNVRETIKTCRSTSNLRDLVYPELSESPWRPGEPLFFSGNWTTPKKAAAFWDWLVSTGITAGYTEYYPDLLPAPSSRFQRV